jgi:hypothetical protein
LNKDQNLSKFKSNIQSNVNKQLQPSLLTNYNYFKNKQQNVNIQVFNSRNNLELSYTSTSPPQYNARSNPSKVTYNQTIVGFSISLFNSKKMKYLYYIIYNIYCN